MADNCIYKIKQSDGTEREFKDIDELRDHLLSDEVGKEDILSQLKNLGFAQPKDELILSPRGFIPLGDLRIGDFVYSENGFPVLVEDIYQRGFLDIYKVFFEDGSFVRCSEDHLWTVYKKEKESEIKDDSIGITLPTIEVCDFLKREYIIRLPELYPVQFSEKKLLIPPYTLGVILGDGSICKSYARITGIDLEICEKTMSENPGIAKRLNDTWNGLYAWRLSFKNNEIIDLDLFDKNAFEKRIPEIYFISSIDQRIELLRGLLDTDGTITRRNEVKFYSSNEGLADDVRKLVLSLGGIASKNYYKIKSSFRTTNEGTYCVNISININPFYLPRKANRWKMKFKGIRRRIIKIEKDNSPADCVCILVNSASSLYLTKDYIITHNTNKYATPSSQEQIQESDQQTGVGEHPRTGTSRDEETEPKTDNSDSGSNGTGTEREKEVAKEEPRTVSTKNAAVNEDMAARKLKPIIKEARRRFGKVWSDAREEVLNGHVDPRGYVNYLSERLAKGEKFGVSDRDNAVVLMDRIDLTNDRMQALEDYEKALKQGNDYLESNAWTRLQDTERLLNQNDEVSDKIGTIAGRALSSRRMLARLDYSLVEMKREVGKYYPDGKVPPEVAARLEKIEKDHADALQKLTEYEDRWKKEQADKAYQDELNKGKKDPKEKKTTTKKGAKLAGKELADKFRSFRPKTDAAQSNIFGLPIAIYDTALVIVANAAEAGGSAIEAIQKGIDYIKENNPFASQKDEDDFRAHLSGVDEPEEVDPKQTFSDKIRQLAQDQNAQTITKEMITPLRRLINQYAREGRPDLQSVLEEVHEQLKGDFTDLSVDDLRDAYSGYGSTRLETQTELQRKLAQWKNEAKTWGQMQDILKEKQPKKGGRTKEFDAKLQKQRKELEKNMKNLGLTWENAPATEEEKNARALSSLKTRIQTEITNLTQAISDKKPIERNGRKIALDDEAKAMKAQRDQLKEVLNKILGKEDKKTLTDSDRIKRAQDVLEKQIADLQKDIDDVYANTYEGKKAPSELPFNSTVELLRGRKEILQELKRKLVVDYDPKSNESQIALEKYKDTLRNRILDYSRRIEDKDFETHPDKPSIKNDADAHKLELQVKRAQSAFQQEKLLAQRDNKSTLAKIFKKVIQLKRFGILFNFPIIGKIAAQNLYRTVFNPVEELIGAGAHAIPGLRTISMQAPREGGGFNITAEGLALGEWVKAQTWKDALSVLKTGQGELDHMFGTQVSMPPEMLEVWGHLHGALQTPVKRAEFARSYEKRMHYAVDVKGANPNDELVQLTAQSKAFEDANRSVFLQKNAFSDWFNRVVTSGENSENVFKNFGSALARYFVAFTKLPANVIRETGTYYLGLPRFAIESLVRTIDGSINNLSEEQADSLMRSLKKGTIGAGMFAIGFAMPSAFGGLYYKGRPNKNKDEKDQLDVGEIKIGDVTLPKWLAWSPVGLMLQFGATTRKVMNRDERSGSDNAVALTDGIVKSSRGLFGEAPLFNQVEEIEEAAEDKDPMNKLLYPELLSPIPGILPEIAKRMDTDDSGKPVKRYPIGIGQQIQYRIPGLRDNIPSTEDRKKEKAAERQRQREAEENNF